MPSRAALWTSAALACAYGVGAPPQAASHESSNARPFSVRIFRFVDSSRTIRLPDGRHVPRSLPTVVRYPVTGGMHPLVVFAHGFALTPATYAALLQAWAREGYVVAAPAFPLENANAPTGPRESDLINEPADVSYVIGRLLSLNTQSGGVLERKIDASQIAVAGHSDGAEAALGVAYDHRFRDPRVRAAIVLSGAELPGMGPFPRPAAALLAVQGTADTINAPATTTAYFRHAPRPKFLLWLVGASHLAPYTDQQPQLAIVERVTLAFLGHYLEGRPLRALDAAARHPGLTRLRADP